MLCSATVTVNAWYACDPWSFDWEQINIYMIMIDAAFVNEVLC